MIQSLEQVEQIEGCLTEIQEQKVECTRLELDYGQITGIWKSVYDKYGHKLERIRKSLKMSVTREEIDLLKQSVYDESLGTRIKRFIGLKQKQLEVYNELMDRLDFLKSHYEGQLNSVRGRMDAREGELKELLARYKRAYTQVCAGYSGADPKAWETYKQPEDPESKVYIGDLALEITDDKTCAASFHGSLGNAWGPMGIKAPCLFMLDTPIKLGIIYNNDQEKTKASGLVRSIIFQVIRNIPMYNYQFVCLDYKNSGSYLGELRGLETFVDSYAEGIHIELLGGRYQMLTLSSTESGIQETLNKLENYIDAVSRLLGGAESVREFNEASSEKIPCLFFIMDAFPEGLNDSGRRKLEKLLINGERCGISFLFTLHKQFLPGFEDSMKAAGIKGPDYGIILCGRNEEELVFDTVRGPFLISDMYDRRQSYVDSVLNILEASKNIDNRFEHVFDLNQAFGQRDSTDYITVPFAINMRGKVEELGLGSKSQYAFALLSGGTGSGKSTLLHMLINSIVMHYIPEDVQLWLVDYKLVEFYSYTRNRPPHVKFIGLEKSEEFTFAFIRHMNMECERRMGLFKEKNLTEIDTYKKRYGKDSIPRIVIIIDEFHVMTNQIRGTEYAVMLEDFLKQARALGMTCVFSDQAVSAGLAGLTEASRMQIRTRLAMANDDPDEIKETLSLKQGSDYDIRPMSTGEVTIRRMIETRNEKGEDENKVVLDRAKVVFISDKYKEWTCTKARAQFPDGTSPIIVDGRNRVMADLSRIEEYDNNNHRDGRIWLHLGKPSNLEQCFCIRLLRNFGQNVMSVGPDSELQASLLFHSIESFKRQPDYQIYIMADEGDEMYLKYEPYFRKLGQEPYIELLRDYEGICRTVCQLQREMYARRKRQSSRNIMVFWIGMDNIALELSYYPEDRPRRPESEAQARGMNKDPLTSTLDSMGQLFSQLFPGEEPLLPAGKPTDDENTLYNASDDIGELTGEGPKRGIYHFIFYSSVLPIKKARFIKLENFICKIAFQMDEDSCLNYFGKSKIMKDISRETAVYYDGGQIVRRFLPYLLPAGLDEK